MLETGARKLLQPSDDGVGLLEDIFMTAIDPKILKRDGGLGRLYRDLYTLGLLELGDDDPEVGTFFVCHGLCTQILGFMQFCHWTSVWAGRLLLPRVEGWHRDVP